MAKSRLSYKEVEKREDLYVPASFTERITVPFNVLNLAVIGAVPVGAVAYLSTRKKEEYYW